MKLQVTLVRIFFFLCFLILVTGSQRAHAADVLEAVNAKRVRMGLYPFERDDKLTALAERESSQQVRRGQMGHFTGAPRPAKAAGVGYTHHNDPTGRYFKTCYSTTRRFRYAGASAIVSRNGRTYFSLMLR